MSGIRMLVRKGGAHRKAEIFNFIERHAADLQDPGHLVICHEEQVAGRTEPHRTDLRGSRDDC